MMEKIALVLAMVLLVSGCVSDMKRDVVELQQDLETQNNFSLVFIVPKGAPDDAYLIHKDSEGKNLLYKQVEEGKFSPLTVETEALKRFLQGLKDNG